MREVKEENVIYAYSHCEAWLETYCRSHSLSYDELADKVAGLFSSLKRSGNSSNFPPTVPDEREYQFSPGAVAEYKHQAKQDSKSNETQVSTSLDPIDREIRKPIRWMKCKYCSKKLRNVDMGNHVKYSHHTTSKVAKKRKHLSPKVLAAMKRNLVLARAASLKSRKKKRKLSSEGLKRIKQGVSNYWKVRKEREQREEQKQQEEKKMNQTLEMPEQESIAS